MIYRLPRSFLLKPFTVPEPSRFVSCRWCDLRIVNMFAYPCYFLCSATIPVVPGCCWYHSTIGFSIHCGPCRINSCYCCTLKYFRHCCCCRICCTMRSGLQVRGFVLVRSRSSMIFRCPLVVESANFPQIFRGLCWYGVLRLAQPSSVRSHRLFFVLISYGIAIIIARNKPKMERFN